MKYLYPKLLSIFSCQKIQLAPAYQPTGPHTQEICILLFFVCVCEQHPSQMTMTTCTQRQWQSSGAYISTLSHCNHISSSAQLKYIKPSLSLSLSLFIKRNISVGAKCLFREFGELSQARCRSWICTHSAFFDGTFYRAMESSS